MGWLNFEILDFFVVVEDMDFFHEVYENRWVLVFIFVFMVEDLYFWVVWILFFSFDFYFSGFFYEDDECYEDGDEDK
jgi:hypothetical protein